MNRYSITIIMIVIALVTLGLSFCLDSRVSRYRQTKDLTHREDHLNLDDRRMFCQYRLDVEVYKDTLLTEYGY